MIISIPNQTGRAPNTVSPIAANSPQMTAIGIDWLIMNTPTMTAAITKSERTKGEKMVSYSPL